MEIERRIDVVNSILHWFFTFYPVSFMIMMCIAFSALDCKSQGLFVKTSNPLLCNDPSVVYPAYVVIIFTLLQGIVVIYLLRNHRFAENNSFKRRFAFIQILNLCISFMMILMHYQEDVIVLIILIYLSTLFNNIFINIFYQEEQPNTDNKILARYMLRDLINIRLIL